MSKILADKKWYREAERGLIDAGRKTKTKVQDAVYKQMGLKSGTKRKIVVANMRGKSQGKALTYEIFGVVGGRKIQQYKGLRILKSTGKAAARFNSSQSAFDRGAVRSAVWNAPRVFKRSFGHGTSTYAMLPGNLKDIPIILRTPGVKPGQKRGPNGRFLSSGARQTYGKLRQLYGASLTKEVPKGASLQAFHRVAPPLVKFHVEKRLAKLMRY